ncbi:lytic murein transglycosylase [Limimaricola variabilis]|uniref:Lytic murein transglycosylase n=1 Tax=Limimaricola variabilis TaxID=1492771 RepID=A0ABR6HL35_9RHOB|nr:lytic murein transglycosylase [Limimaricola variabilis]
MRNLTTFGRAGLLGLALAALASCGAVSGPLDSSLRPPARAEKMDENMRPRPNAGFSNWVAGYRPRALSAGVSGATFDHAFASAGYIPGVIEKDRNQAEFTKTLGEYLSTAASDTRVETGRAMLSQYSSLLSEIEARYGVDRQTVLAVWGMESNFGKRRGDVPVVSALATLAYEGRRGRFFEQQLTSALKILQNGDVSPENMKGSWAGAMGHTQFIPTSYEAYAADFRGDGRRDIWSDDPTDGLASTAKYLSSFGWRRGQPWGVEVVLPAGFNYGLAGGTKKSAAEWQALGVQAATGGRIGDFGAAEILVPEGAQGAAFMTFKNFDVIKRYNAADAYAIGVGHLGDRIAGAGPFRTPMATGRALNRAERSEVQRRLTALGFDTGGADGIIGPNTTAAIRRYQQVNGLPVDGFASESLLKRLR